MPPVNRVSVGTTPVSTTVPAADVTPVATVTPPATPAPVGLDAATTGGNVPASGGSVLGTAVRGLSALGARGFTANSTPELFALVPGRVPNAVDLPTVLKGLGQQPNSGAAVKNLLDGFKASTGVEVPPALAAAAMANPQRLLDAMKVTPRQMSDGFKALNAAHASGQVKDTAPRQHVLPQRVDLAKLDKVAFTRPEPAPKELAPGLLQGDVKNVDLPDADAKVRTVMAEVLDRLADNANLPEKDRFAVRFGDRTFTRLDTFMAALIADGYTVNVNVEQRVANFAALSTRAPDGSLVDIPAPVMVMLDTGAGEQVALPSVHSELVIDIHPGPDTKGPKLDARVKWYQGVPYTGFFPAELSRTPPWCGHSVLAELHGKDAQKAVSLAGLMSDVVNDTTKAQGLYASGYGVTGVCNDSVAIIQHAVTGKVSPFPLLMQDAVLLAGLDARMHDKDRRDDAGYRTLAASVKAVPSDVEVNATSFQRALQSIPWAAGEEPFGPTAAARAALTARVTPQG